MVKGAVLRTAARSVRGFEPHSQHIAPIAQLVERQAVNLKVTGSNPVGSVLYSLIISNTINEYTIRMYYRVFDTTGFVYE